MNNDEVESILEEVSALSGRVKSLLGDLRRNYYESPPDNEALSGAHARGYEQGRRDTEADVCAWLHGPTSSLTVPDASVARAIIDAIKSGKARGAAKWKP